MGNSFKIWLESSQGLFVGFKIDPYSAEILHDWVSNLIIGIDPLPKPVPVDKLHVTALRNKDVSGEFKPLGQINIWCDVLGFRTYKDRDGLPLLVMVFKSPWVEERIKQIRKSMNVVDLSIPHISLCYNFHLNINKLKSPIKGFHLIEEFVSPFILNWSKSL